MNVADRMNVSIGLSAVPASQASFSVPVLLVDHADVPLDRRYRIVTKSSYTTDLTAASVALNWCASLWGQNYNPAQAYIGRWISAASSPYCVCVGFETTIATWAAVSDGSLTVTTTAGADVMTAINFTGDTTLANVAATIDAKLVAGGLSGARCYVDALDRIYFVDEGVTGTGADTVVLSGGGGGTDLYLAAWLNGASSFQVGGLDIEAQGTALNAILALDNTPYIVCQNGGSVAQVTALSTVVNALDKYLMLVSNDANAKDGGDTTDFCYAISQLTHQKTHMCYTEHTTHYPDAVASGEILARLNSEGAVSLANNALSGVYRSGLDPDGTTVIPLTATEIAALEGKGCDYLIKLATAVTLANGLSAGGHEARVMIGKAFMASNIATDCYNYLPGQDVVTYSDDDVSAIKQIVSYWAYEMADRGLLDVDTFAWNFPDAEDFTAAQMATHVMTLSNVFSANYLPAANTMVMTLDFTI